MMNIVLATDDNFVQHCGTTIKSITTNNHDVNFFILTESLNTVNMKLLKEIGSDNGCTLEFCIVPSDIVKFFPMSKMASNHISIATYYRLFITTLLPDNIDKAIYLDCDMIIRGSLEGMWKTDVSKVPLAAVYQHQEWSDYNNSWERLYIPREEGYFNAGSLVLNLKYLREYNFQEKAIDYINKHFERIISHDQDVLNAMFYDKVVMLDCKWNYLPLFIGKAFDKSEFPAKCHYREEKESKSFNPVVIHFVSKPKPWNYGCDNPYTSEYFKYLALTPWKGYKVKFTWKAFIEYKLTPMIKSCIRSLDFLHIIDKVHKTRVK